MTSYANFLKISCLDRAEAVAAKHDAEIVISLLSPDMRPPSFRSAALLRKHLAFYFYDQESVLPLGMSEAVADLIMLGKSWHQNQKFPKSVIHCHGGVSRSPATTYILLCTAFPAISPAAHFETLLRIAPKPWPNLRMITIADDVLNAGGDIVKPLITYRAANPKRMDVYRRLNRRRGIMDKPR